MKFKESVQQHQLDKLQMLFMAMPEKVDGVVSVEWGFNNSPEKKNQGYTHCVQMTFSNKQGRQNYLPHPEHDSLKTYFAPMIEDIIVFDYQV